MFLRRVSGRSMVPTLTPGQLVIAHPQSSMKEGDIIIFLHNGLELVKRIAAVTQAGYIVRGDNSSESTDSAQFGIVRESAIKGKVIWPKK